MNFIDWFIIAVIALSSLLGLIRGLLRESIALVAWLLGLWLAWTFSYVVEPHLGGMLAEPQVRVWVARLIILFAVLLLGSLVGVILAYFVRHSPFGTLDRGFGVLFGLLRGMVMIGLGVIAGQLFALDAEGWWQASGLMPAAESLAEWIRHLVDDVEPVVRDLI
jgi:membrane protein required for colicin V production